MTTRSLSRGRTSIMSLFKKIILDPCFLPEIQGALVGTIFVVKSCGAYFFWEELDSHPPTMLLMMILELCLSIILGRW